MRLRIGPWSYDLTTRALVVGLLDADAMATAELGLQRADVLVAAGADIVEVTGQDPEQIRTVVSALAASGAVPVASVTATPGATFVRYHRGIQLDRTAAVIALTPDEAAHALGEGIAADRIVLDLGPRVRPGPADTALGCPLLASATAANLARLDVDASERRAGGLAAVALAVSEGCRLVRADDVRGARRVCDVLAAVLGAVVAEVAETRQ